MPLVPKYWSDRAGLVCWRGQRPGGRWRISIGRVLCVHTSHLINLKTRKCWASRKN